MCSSGWPRIEQAQANSARYGIAFRAAVFEGEQAGSGSDERRRAGDGQSGDSEPVGAFIMITSGGRDDDPCW